MKLYISVDMEGIGGVAGSWQVMQDPGALPDVRQRVTGEVNAAIEGARQATDLPVTLTMSFGTHGRTMMGVRPEDAIKAFDQAIAADPKHEVSRMNKGIVLLHDLNDFDGAIRAWEGLLEVNPIATAPNGVSIDSMVVQLKKQQAEQGPKSQ